MLHLNAIFIEQFAKKLGHKIRNKTIQACFSNSKDEWYLQWEDGVFQIQFYQKLPFFLFPESDKLPVRNRLSFGKELPGLMILEVIIYRTERCFAIRLKEDFTLLFKLYGHMSDILLFNGNDCIQSFRKQHQVINEKLTDFGPIALGNTFEQVVNPQIFGWEAFRKSLPWFPVELKEEVLKDGFHAALNSKQWLKFAESRIEKGPYFLEKSDTGLFLTLTKNGPAETSKDILQASHSFSKTYISSDSFLRQKTLLLNEKIRQLKSVIVKLNQKEEQLRNMSVGLSYSQKADIIMANLQTLQKGIQEVELFDFYQNQPIVLKLKPELNPQQNAAILYRKSKNEHIAKEKLEESIDSLKIQAMTLESAMEVIKNAEHWSSIEKGLISKIVIKSVKLKSEKQAIKGRLFEKDGFEIWVGRNALENDQLLQKAHKEDIWLHARGVKGSHVIIKSNLQNPPVYIIEFAASLAAHFSDARGNKLAAVVFTPRKFVRKSKRMAVGQVMVDREEVLMVKPWKKIEGMG